MCKSIAAAFVGLLITTLFSISAGSAEEETVDLKIDDVAPVFAGVDDRGKEWKSSDRVGDKIVVVYFYPADFTTGCTKQAETWRDNMNAVAGKGVEVIGVSGDSAMNHKLFKEAWKLNFTLLADEKGVIAKQFGVPSRQGGKVRPRGPDRKPLVDEKGQRLLLERQSTFKRWTFVIGKDKKVAYKNTKVVPAKDSSQVLKFVDGLDAKPAKP